MDLGHIVADFNWLAIIVATLAAFGLGAVWYIKGMFGAAWMQYVGLTEEDANTANTLRPLAVHSCSSSLRQ